MVGGGLILVGFGGWVVCWGIVVLFGSSFCYVLGVVFYIRVEGVGAYLGGFYIFGILGLYCC